MNKKSSFQFYIGIGMIVGSLAFLLYEYGVITHIIQLLLYIIAILLEIFGAIKYRQDFN